MPYAPQSGRSSMVERELPKLYTRVRFPSPAPESPQVEPFEKTPVLSACYAVVLTNMLRRSTIVHYFETCHEWLLGEMRV